MAQNLRLFSRTEAHSVIAARTDHIDPVANSSSPGRMKPPRAWVSFWAPFTAMVLLAFLSQRELFRTRLDAWGDSAVNGLSIFRAEHLEQLVGNYSRVGFHHPGPFFFYLLGSGEALFYHVLHVVPGPYNGQLLAASIYVAACLSLVCLAIYRWTSSVPATIASAAVLLVFAARTPLFGQDWFPYLYVSAFLLFVVAGAATASGRTAEMPSFVLSGSILVHGHVSFLLFVGVTVLSVGVLWWLGHRGHIREEIRRHRAAAATVAAVIALAALPLVLDLILHFPGEWPGYLTFALHGEHSARTPGQVNRFVAYSWTHSDLPWPAYVAIGALGLGLALTERDRVRRRAVWTAFGMLLLQTVLYVYYVVRGVDFLTPLATYSYVGYFYRAVPVALVLLVIAHACLRVSGTAALRRRPWSLSALSGVAALGLVALTVGSGDLGRFALGGESFVRGAATVDRLREGRAPVVIQDPTGAVWPTAAAIGLELTYRDVSWCVEGPNANPIVYGAEHVCTPAQSAGGFRVVVTNQPAPTRDAVFWKDRPADPRIAPGRVRAYLAP